MSEWPKYESHKVVQAARIVSVAMHHDGSRTIFVRAEGDELAERFEPSVPAMAEKAEVGGFAVVYPDGFKSISPERAFIEGYTKA